MKGREDFLQLLDKIEGLPIGKTYTGTTVFLSRNRKTPKSISGLFLISRSQAENTFVLRTAEPSGKLF